MRGMGIINFGPKCGLMDMRQRKGGPETLCEKIEGYKCKEF
jgi:hypothetical protein